MSRPELRGENEMTLLKQRNGRLAGAEVVRYRAQSWPTQRGKVRIEDWALLRRAERQAEIERMASVNLDGGTHPAMLIVIHRSDMSWEYQDEDYKDGDYVYRLGFGDTLSYTISGRNCAAFHLSLGRKSRQRERQEAQS